ncbi:MAG TPA: toll/interleukin-1 receptor domain-containing protein [Planctomycetota bacterium]|nr:toll/interleukin-1 receptor domain-containing protein [Planctomycetota bacterium]
MARSRGGKPAELFLSHANSDRETAGAIAGTLRQHGIPVWFSSTNIQGAQQWHDEIGAALARCDWFLLLLSKKAVVRPWVKRELLFALNDRRYENRIMPVLLGACDWKRLSWTLGALQMINMTRDVAAAYREILATWGVGLDPSRCVTPRRPRRR